MKELRVGIVGAGNMGWAHLNCIYNREVAGLTVTAACDCDTVRLAEVGKAFPGLNLYEDYRALLKDGKVDALIVATPHPLHAEIGIAALASGRHLLVEKPEDISVTKAEKLNETAKKSGRVFGIMFNQRTNTLFQQARGLVRGGELGGLKRTVWIITNWYRTQSYYDSGDWRATWGGEGGGVLLNQAPHNLDLWQWICGMPAAVSALCETAKYHNIEVEDEAILRTRYANGANGIFITSTGEFPGTNRLEISGTKGKIVIEDGLLKHWRLETDEREVCKTSEEGFCSIPFEYKEYRSKGETAHKGILQNFTDAVLRGEELLAPGFDGINELTLSNAAYLSQWLGGKEISLPFDASEFDRLLSEHVSVSKYRPNGAHSTREQGYDPRWQVRW